MHHQMGRRSPPAALIPPILRAVYEILFSLAETSQTQSLSDTINTANFVDYVRCREAKSFQLQGSTTGPRAPARGTAHTPL